ncbi:MAG: hypothetical protein V1790_09790 [Planctomycetota bacterium]
MRTTGGAFAQEMSCQNFRAETPAIGNADLRKLLRTDNTLLASKLLRDLVDGGLLVVANPGAAKQNRRYKLPEQDPIAPLLSEEVRKQARDGS